MLRSCSFSLFGLMLLLPPVFSAEPAEKTQPTREGIEFFESKIRPVLVNECYECHSLEAKKKDKLEGELLLDSSAAMLKGGDTGPSIIPGDVANSLLIAAIRHESFEMPPKNKLSDQVIADFEQWIKMGAPDPRDGKAPELQKEKMDVAKGREYWSFQPLNQSAPPIPKNKTWGKTPVDQFILAKQEAQGITPNELASRQTLIRRVYFDLWGLPPEPQEVESFINDASPDAYEKLIDRLLAGQHYGERWARHWLDLSRFAESNGYAFDRDRPAAYHFRDFVIKAFNEDLPYDQFIRLQIAGDLLGPTDYMSQAATGFLAAGPFTSQQTQKERERSRYEQLDDLIHTIGTTTLGLTLGCARCHDHKFDPVPTHDYYRMIAAFAETGFQDYQHDLNPEKYNKEKAAFDVTHKPFVDARLKYEKESLPAKLAEWLEKRPTESIQPKLSDWHAIGPFKSANFLQAFNQPFEPEKKVDLTKTYSKGLLKWTPQPTWTDGKIHNTLTGDNSANYLFRTIEVPQAGPLEISLGRDDAIKVWLNGKSVLSKNVTGGAAADQDKVTLALKAGENELLVKIVNASGPSGFYFKAKDTTPPKEIQTILALSNEKRTDPQQQELLKWYAPYDAGWAALNDAEQENMKKHPQRDLLPVFAARKGGATYNFGEDTRKVYYLVRGNSNRKNGLAAPGFLQVLMTGETQEKQWLLELSKADQPRHPRVAFADWLTDTSQGAGHLLARVMVNRLWHHHFGRGIVETPSDFGTQGFRPTHPELLDYLAVQLIQGNWNLKPIHKLIMMSSVYQQSGQSSASGLKHDPENHLWWRRPAIRMDAEVIRDDLLAVSGTLDKKMFGPGTLNQEDRRRSIYLTVKRDKLIPILQLFDAPDEPPAYNILFVQNAEIGVHKFHYPFPGYPRVSCDILLS
ncbi:MAG: PSD1 and planctomycete cytochrome C domain-containing protein, partial [Planctomycetota bacterium]